MKHVIRILVTLIVLVALGFGAWAIWFKPDPNQSTFLALNKMQDKVAQYKIEENLQNLYDAKGHGTYTWTVKKMKKVTTYQLQKKNGLAYKDEIPQNYTVTVDEILLNTKSEQRINQLLFDKSEGSLNKGVSVNYDDIRAIRDILFKSKGASSKVPVNLDSSLLLLKTGETKYSFYSYTTMKEQLDKMYTEYISYTQMAKGVSSSAQKQIKKDIDNYLNAVSALNSSLTSTLNYQKVYTLKSSTDLIEKSYEGSVEAVEGDQKYSLPGKTGKKIEYTMTKIYNVEIYPNFTGDDAAGYTELSYRYENVLKNYRNMLKTYSTLIAHLKDFVVNYVFDGKTINDLTIVKYDLMLMAIQNGVNGNYDLLEDKQKSCAILQDAINFINPVLGKKEIDDYSLVTYYNRITSQYKEGLDKIMALSNAEKNKFALGESISVDIKNDYKNDLQEILTLYGYGSKISQGTN